MAKKPSYPATPKASEPPGPGLEQQANTRHQECRRLKSQWASDFKEAYFFTAPLRMRHMDSENDATTSRPQDAAELQTDLAQEIGQDFVTEVDNTFMQDAQKWCERDRGMFVPENEWKKGKEEARKQDEQIFIAIRASNLKPEIAKAYYPDLYIGTAGIWIDQRRPHEPIICSAVPLREFDLNLGPYGEIDDRFVNRHTRNCHVGTLLPEVKEFPDEVAKAMRDDPGGRTKISWGFWRKWDEDDECWQHIILVKNKLVHDAVLKGEGSCPFIPHRWNPSADWPFGHGPMLQSLPSYRQVDELETDMIINLNMHLKPPFSFPNDSFGKIGENGLQAGMGYPIERGAADDIKEIFKPGAPDPAAYAYEEKERRLRRLAFVDYPKQTGDTPPTLGQWLDELARSQRRIGTPGHSYWREGPAKIFLRFKYLLERAGTIKPIATTDGRAISMRAVNPAQRAAEQQEIATAIQFLQHMLQAFPEEAKVAIDGQATIQAFFDKMRVNLVKFRDPETVKDALARIQSLMGNQGAGLAAIKPAQPIGPG